MTRRPLISVIVPIYNVAPLLNGALESLDHQTFQDFEAILVDDGSVDESGALAESFAADHPNFVVIHQENKGLSGARNTGLNAARGQYIFFLDSDDYLHPKALEVMYRLAQESRADIVSASYVHTSKTYAPAFEPLTRGRIDKHLSKRPLESFLEGKNIHSNVWTKLYKAAVIRDLRFIEGIYFEDVPFTVMALDRAGSVLITDLPIYYYYKNPNSIMRTSFTEKKVDSYLKLINEIALYVRSARPELFDVVRRRVLNKRFKMMVNQCVRKQKDKAVRRQLFDVMQPGVHQLVAAGAISYDGLKWYHKAALFLLLHAASSTPARIWMQSVKLFG